MEVFMNDFYIWRIIKKLSNQPRNRVIEMQREKICAQMRNVIFMVIEGIV